MGRSGVKYVLFVGTVQPRKNLAALIDAFSHFASGYVGDTVPLKLVIAGGIGWMAEEIL
jgi:glycosyltransferase involved in cell wall biosynthesis